MLSFCEEAADSVDCMVGQVRRYVGQHDQSHPVGMTRSGNQARLSTPRCSDKGYAAVELREQTFYIAGNRLDMIIAIRRPFAFAMASQVECYAVISGVCDDLRRSAPRIAALASAMEEQDGRCGRVAIGVPGERQPVCFELFQFAAQVRP